MVIAVIILHFRLQPQYNMNFIYVSQNISDILNLETPADLSQMKWQQGVQFQWDQVKCTRFHTC